MLSPELKQRTANEQTGQTGQNRNGKEGGVI